MTKAAVPGFVPSASGFRFANDFPRVPLRRIGVPGLVSIPVGDASNGLCGGMVFAARDYFEAGRAPPPLTSAPHSGPLYDYLVKRLFDSFNLPHGPARYLRLMRPSLPDTETRWSRMGLRPHGRAWVVAREWPKVRAAIDAGRPSPLGLIRVKSNNPLDLKHHHQVLAYAYEVKGRRLRVAVYDPNRPGRDDISLSMGLGDPSRPIHIRAEPPDWPVYAFFRVSYRPSMPP